MADKGREISLKDNTSLEMEGLRPEWYVSAIYHAHQSCRESSKYDIVGQQGTVWTRIAKDRESWRIWAEGYYLQWKNTA